MLKLDKFSTQAVFVKNYEIRLFKSDYTHIPMVNQRGSVSQNILKSIFFWLGPFLALIFEFKITNYSFIDCE